jgi:hypothetical protein
VIETLTTGPEVGTSWHSYPSIYNLGHAAVKDLFSEPVLVQEKVDGSQFSFGVFDGKLRVKSKGKEMDPAAPEKLFARAVETVRQLDLTEGWTYRGEVLDKPKHNVLTYDRVPRGHVVLFDINRGHEDYLSITGVAFEADRIGLEFVPTYSEDARGAFTEATLREYLERESFLGGQKIEGVVIKSLSLFGTDKKRLMGKFVSESFRESHAKVWGENSKARSDILDRIVAALKTDARWQKAVIHLRERGEIADSPRDIPALIRETQTDLWKEEAEAITTALVTHFERDINKRITAGIADWYKAELLKKQFEVTA